MPFRPEDLYERGVIGRVAKEQPDMPLRQLIYYLAESVSEAQTKLDLNTAEVLKVLAETEVDVIPRVQKEVDADGKLVYSQAPAQRASLLALGFAPTRYQFSEATVEINFDVKISEKQDSTQKSEYELRAATYDLRTERKYQRDVTAGAKVVAKLVPTPLPVQIEPIQEP